MKGNTPLMLASWRGHSAILRLVLEYTDSHCSINRYAKCIANSTLYSTGTCDKFPTLTIQAMQLQINSSKTIFYLQHSDIYRLNTERRTALHLAAASGSAKCTKLLLSSGALSDLRDWHGETPLLLASEQGCEAVVALLIKEGCDIRATNDSGWNALHLAIKKGHCHVAHRLIAAGKTI